ncbi:hypothetical protein V499_02732 [Pseudogymnoascus sp. VKM F-103]|nr:hypothetical protein V499_02732 [Pseudogymnoascus sp. VKM F-103]
MEMEYIVYLNNAGKSSVNGSLSDSQHVSSPTASATAVVAKKPGKRQHAYPRKRAIQACTICRIKRTKCDNSRPACILDQDASQGQGFLSLSTPIAAQPLSLERPADWRPSYIHIETVLSWSVFVDLDFTERPNLRSLLRSDKSHATVPILPIPADFGLHTARQLLQKFLDNVHIFNPILEETIVREYMLATSLNGLRRDAQSCLMLLIYALGSIANPYEKSPRMMSYGFRQSTEFRQAESFFVAAQNRMGLLLCGSGVIEAQCFFLAGVYLMATLRPIEAWKIFVQALACCQTFSSNLAIPNARTDDNSRLEQTIYWTCFKSELELRRELNMFENRVWDLTYPALFPTPPEGLKSQDEVVWYFYLAEIALRRLGNRILNYVYCYYSSIDSDSNNNAILDFESQADSWLQSLPTALSIETVNPEHKKYAALCFILHGHLLDCKEMMYWQAIVDTVHRRQCGSSTELFVRKGLLVCVQRVQINEEGFYHRHHGTWLMLRSCTRSALVLLAAARCPELVPTLPEGWEEAILKVVDMLSFWKDESMQVLDMLFILERLIEVVAPEILKNR